MKNRLKYILIILILLFILVTVLTKMDLMGSFDSYLSEFVQNSIPESFNSIMLFITALGGTKILPIVVIGVSIVLILMNKKKYGLLIFGNSLLSTVGYLIIKNIVQRPRPFPHLYITETGFSFPSGHTTCITAFCGILIYFIWKKIKNTKLKIALTCALIIWIILIGTTRIFFNVHYPSDVLAGIILGSVCVYISIAFSKKFNIF